MLIHSLNDSTVPSRLSVAYSLQPPYPWAMMSFYKPVTMCTSVCYVRVPRYFCHGTVYISWVFPIPGSKPVYGASPHLTSMCWLQTGLAWRWILLLVEVGFYQVLACCLSSGRGQRVPCNWCILVAAGRPTCHNCQGDFVVLRLYHTEPSERSLHMGFRAYWYGGVFT